MMVSIIIATTHQTAMVQSAVASALTACPADGEVIVVDDHSGTAVKALGAIDDHPRLRIVISTAEPGAAGARNHGVAQALGEVVIFLDIADTMVADYPKRVLLAVQSSAADWGFAHQPKAGSDGSATIVTGIVGQNVQLLDRLPDFSAGFWIKRSVFRQIGPIRTDLVVDADYDFCLRLHSRGHQAWFDATAASLTQKTAGTEPPPLAVSYDRLQTFQRHQSSFGYRSLERWALVRRCLEFAADHGVDETARTLLAGLAPLDWRIRGWLFWQRRKRHNKSSQTVTVA